MNCTLAEVVDHHDVGSIDPTRADKPLTVGRDAHAWLVSKAWIAMDRNQPPYTMGREVMEVYGLQRLGIAVDTIVI